MTETDFWSFIALIDQSLLNKSTDNSSAADLLITTLSSRDVKELESFEEHLALVLYKLDGEKFANECTKQGSSDDGFLYARAYVVAKGLSHYQAVLASPELMPKGYEGFDTLLGCATFAWQRVHGEDAELSYITSVSYDTGSNSAGWANYLSGLYR